MDYQAIKINQAGSVSRIVFDRPPVNAVTIELLQELHDALDVLEARDETRCIVVTGAGTKAFCAGADLVKKGGAADDGTHFSNLGRAALNRLETISKPVIAAIRGWCIGGAEHYYSTSLIFTELELEASCR